MSVLMDLGSMGVARMQVSTVTCPPNRSNGARAPLCLANSRMARLEVTRNCQRKMRASQDQTIFTGRLVRETQVGDYPAVVPNLSGQAWITGFAQYVVDPEDPFPNGFTTGDIWGRAED